MANRRQRKKSEALRVSRAVRGIQRAEHFAAGGTPTTWRGTSGVTRNGKAHARKRACRGANQNYED